MESNIRRAGTALHVKTQGLNALEYPCKGHGPTSSNTEVEESSLKIEAQSELLSAIRSSAGGVKASLSWKSQDRRKREIRGRDSMRDETFRA
ncbi:hypothetical protein AAC387_Pa07g2580 [Persea americana]